jgi:hypothetical protein
MLQWRAGGGQRGHTAAMKPLQLFAVLHGRPGGAVAFRLAVKVRLQLRELSVLALTPLLEWDLPCRGWAWRRRLEISAAWDSDLSQLRYIEAMLTEQPE